MSNPASPHKIVVTGATSMIGHFVLPRLLDAGYEVHAISRTPGGNAIDTTDKKMFWHQADISHPEQLPESMRRYSFILPPCGYCRRYCQS